MKKVFILIVAFATTFISYSQDLENQELLNQLSLNMNSQIDLLETYHKQLGEEIKMLRRQDETTTVKSLKQKKEKLKKPTFAGFEVIVGISDNEGLAAHANFNIEIDDEKHIGLEMGLFYDDNDILLSQDLEVPSEIFIFNLGLTKQLGFLCNKSETITTRFTIGGVIGTEILNEGEDQLDTGELLTTESGLIYGGYVGVFSLFKINNSFSAVFRNSNNSLVMCLWQ